MKSKKRVSGWTHGKKRQELSNLTSKEQFVFTLVRLRRNPSLEMLCDIFGVTKWSGSRIFVTWILFLEKELRFILPFSTKQELIGIPRPSCFKKNRFKNVRAIIDCTKSYVEKPCKPSSQRSTYSQYKSSNTFKLLISMSPILHFNFVSKLYSGSISDKEIVNASGFLGKLQPGDAVMADKGFNIQDFLALHNTELIAPPIMRKTNVSARASTATRRVATAKAHIEWMIRHLKLFTFLRGVIPLTCKPYISCAVSVCEILVKLQPSIIKASSNRK